MNKTEIATQPETASSLVSVFRNLPEKDKIEFLRELVEIAEGEDALISEVSEFLNEWCGS